MGSSVMIETAVADEAIPDLPVYHDRASVPRNLRTALELAAKGYVECGPVYAWLVTQTPDQSLSEPAPAPVHREAFTGRYIGLHSTSEARRLKGYGWTWPKRRLEQDGTATEARKPRERTASDEHARLRSMGRHTPRRTHRYRRPSLKVEPERWLVELFREGFIVIDTETTGLSARDEIIEIAAVSADGTVLFESLVRPKRGFVPAASTRIHGIHYRDVADAPTWPDVMDRLFDVVSGHRLFAWNAGFDERLCAQSSRAWQVPHPLPGFECAMRAYATCRGVGAGSLALQRAALVEGVLAKGQSHRSADDARLAVSVLRRLQRSAAIA